MTHMNALLEAGFDIHDYHATSRKVIEMYPSGQLTRSKAEAIMNSLFGVAVPTSNDKEAEITLRYMITEAVRSHVEGFVEDVEDVVRVATEKTKLFFVNQPWFVPGAHSSIQDIPTAVETIDVPVEDIKIERLMVGTKTVKPKKGLKQEAAKRIFDANKTEKNAVIIALFMKQLDMSKAGATTYLYNLKKAEGTTEVGVKGRKPKDVS